MEARKLQTLKSGRYVLDGGNYVQVVVGRSFTSIEMGKLKLTIDTAIPQPDGSWRVSYTLQGKNHEGILQAAP